MEEIRINDFFFFPDPDLSEVDLVINSDKPQAAVSEPVNDDTDEKYDVYLRLDPETRKIVGATIMHSDNLFDELARAFANRDLNHPEVRFFLEKKLEQYAERHAKELKADSTRAPAVTPAS